jgi:sarcosine oxidase subunit beta
MPEHERAGDAVVIGGGVIGCSIARSLARRGLRTVVVDKGPEPGAGSTSASSAIVRFHYSTLDGVKLAWESKHHWVGWSGVVGAQDHFARFHQIGMIVIDPPGADRERVLALFDRVGVPYERWDADEFARRVPAMDTGRYWPPRTVADERFWADADGRLDAYFTPDAGFVDDPQLAARNLAADAERHGATFRFRRRVTAVDRADDRVSGVRLDDGSAIAAPVVVNAAGPHSAEVNRLAGVLDDFAVGTRALRQEVHVVPAPTGFTLDDGGAVVTDPDLGAYLRPQPGGTLLVGGLEPDCDPLCWIEDPDHFAEHPTPDVFEAQVLRAARRLPGLAVPNRPIGLAALYDVTPDWVPIYDRTALPGFYVAIGTSGNQFKNAPVVGDLVATLVAACEAGHDHDADPVQLTAERTGLQIDIGHYSRRRSPAETTGTVLG